MNKYFDKNPNAANVPNNSQVISSFFFMPFQQINQLVNSKKNAIRGNHAHLFCSQLIVCLEGKIKIKIIDLKNKEYFFELNNTNKNSLFIPKKHWIVLKSKAKHNLIAVFCDLKYDKKKDYVNSFKKFLNK